MTQPPGDKRRTSAPNDVTLPPSSSPSNSAPAGKTGAVPPELVGHSRYRVLGLLGQGGMGAVYLAEHLVMGRRVALKTIADQFLTNKEVIGRFRREVRAVARLVHPNIVTAFDADQAGSLHFLVMEYVEGQSVADYARRKGPLPPEHACVIVYQAAQGLQHAHEQGLIHRDVKPGNLMLTKKGQVKVLDFGLAQFARPEEVLSDGGRTATGAVVGTADYIAPEQTSSTRNVDIRADVYSLGCTLYYLLAGRVPFPEGTVIDKFISHAANTPPALASLRPNLPPELVTVVEKMMAKRPEDRYQTPGEITKALRRFIGAGAAPAAADSSLPAVSAPGASAGPTQTFLSPPTLDGSGKTTNPPRTKIIVASAVAALLVGVSVAALLFSGLIGAKSDSSSHSEDGPSTPSKTVSWTSKGQTHVFVDQPRVLNGILDFQDLVGASPKEFLDWQKRLAKNLRVSFIANRIGSGPPLFNAVAVHQRTSVPTRVFTELTDDESDKTGKRLESEKFGLAGHCVYVKESTGKPLHSHIFVAPSQDPYEWHFTIPDLKARVEKDARDGNKPFSIDLVWQEDECWGCALGTHEPEVKWEVFWTLTRDELLSGVEKYRDRNWRPDVLAPYWDGERFRFVLVVRDNPEPVDWHFRVDMTLAEYKKASAEQKKQGLFPLAVTSHGDGDDVRYSAIWVRYRILDQESR